MILNRQQFADWFEAVEPGMGQAHSVLWIPEEATQQHFEWFVLCTNVNAWRNPYERRKFWSWVRKNLQGHTVCFSSSETEGDWWGFTQRSDIAWFLLRWS